MTPSPIVPQPVAPTRDQPRPEPMHACVRCGRPVPISVAMCEYCNPLGLADPAPTQAHGTVFAAIMAGIVILAILGRYALSGIGPFDASVVSVAPAATGIDVTLTVTNLGTRTGASTCRVYDDHAAGDTSAFIGTPDIAAGQTATFTSPAPALVLRGSSHFVVSCSTP